MKRATLALGILLALATRSGAEPPPPGDPHDDPLGQAFFPPELVMQHQGELGLQESQRTAIQNDVKKAQAFFLDWQWKLSAEVEKLRKLVDAGRIDETQALEQVDRVLAAEREIKRAQLTLLIHIKNVLNDRQREKLEELRRRMPGQPGPPPGGPPGPRP